MKKHFQKKKFLKSGGNDWFNRNLKGKIKTGSESDFDILLPFLSKKDKILEIGCSNGHNLNYIKEQVPEYDLNLYGIDPSSASLKSSEYISSDISLNIGTSDNLEFDDNFFNIIICGFFLYLIDRELVFKTVSEIDRVLKEGGFLFIMDFDVPSPSSNNYRHLKNIKTYKNNYSKFFTGGNHYTLVGKKHFSLKNNHFNENVDERVSSSILYKEFFKKIYTN